EGGPAPDLESLVKDKILAQVPADPFDGQPFRYRVTDGKGVNWGPATEPSAAAAGQPLVSALLWSVGPDGIDNGGWSAGRAEENRSASHWRAKRFDAIYSVPAWPKR